MTKYELLDKIRRRIGMYIGAASPTHLQSFLSGYYLANRMERNKTEEPNFQDFHDWVAKKLGYAESTSGWANMIEDQRVDKEEALFLFFELLDEFKGIKHKQIASVAFNHKEKTNRSKGGYHRLKKVRGTFDEIPKPLPKVIIIQEIKIENGWFQMVAKNEHKAVLFIWNADKLEEIFKKAEALFGIEKEEWET